jgi:hypothetical protein
MGLFNDRWINAETDDSSTCHSDSFGVSESWTPGCAPSPLERFTHAPEFVAFTEHLRRAAQVLTLAYFMRLRRHYDAAWYDILAEL